jgi:2-dehydro-3-deoxyphosphooctonate aldolase (KDO 8-P synthase)
MIRVRDLAIGNDLPLVFLCGPCQIESRAHALEVADALAVMARVAGVGMIYKSSFDKANRTSVNAQRGIGMKEGLAISPRCGSAPGCPPSPTCTCLTIAPPRPRPWTCCRSRPSCVARPTC